MKALSNLSGISGGVHFILFPVVGCAGHTGVTYMNNPDATNYDLGKACGKGALHSLNPGMGLAGRVATSPIGKYAFSIAYGGVIHGGVDTAFPADRNNPYVCPSEQFLGGIED